MLMSYSVCVPNFFPIIYTSPRSLRAEQTSHVNWVREKDRRWGALVGNWMSKWGREEEKTAPTGSDRAPGGDPFSSNWPWRQLIKFSLPLAGLLQHSQGSRSVSCLHLILLGHALGSQYAFCSTSTHRGTMSCPHTLTYTDGRGSSNHVESKLTIRTVIEHADAAEHKNCCMNLQSWEIKRL